MPRKSKREEVKQYIHDEEKRLNNPPVGLVTAETDHMNGKKTFIFDPHLDPQLEWAGKTEGTSFDVDTVSLHVHERIDPLTIIQAIKRKELQAQQTLFGYFETDENNPPIRQAIEFYKHDQGWSNRLIAGDSLLVMNSLLQKEGFAGRVQVVYFDPPYGIKYGSNFQPFVNKKSVRDGKDDDLTQEPEMVKAFRDTWELGIHSYLTYLRNRLLLARELLTNSGSIFVQISDVNVHHVREIMDEVFGSRNFAGIIVFAKTTSATSDLIPVVTDYLLWYGKDIEQLKSGGYHKLYRRMTSKTLDEQYTMFNDSDGVARRMSDLSDAEAEKIPLSRRFMPDNPTSQGHDPKDSKPFDYKGRSYEPGPNRMFPKNIARLVELDRLLPIGKRLRYKRFTTDFPYEEVDNTWTDTVISGFGASKIFVVQTSPKVIERCILMASNPGDLVFDPTCGSGTTAFAAEKWGRRWITCDTSRVAITLAKQRLMTAHFDYYTLANTSKGVAGGFNYEKVQHTTIGSLANDEPIRTEFILDEPDTDKSRRRVSGPFTVEAVPSQRVRNFDEPENISSTDTSIVRSGETSRINDWIDELLSTGIRGRGGQTIEFARVEPLGGTRWIHAEAETKDGKKVVVSFGPEYAPLERRQIELAIEEAQELVPKPKLVIFAAFQFDPEAAKDIDELKWPGVDVLKVQMNTDLFSSDLKKNRSSNESFWLIGQPDVELKPDGEKYQIVVNGFDYYNTVTGNIESGDASRIAMWELDTDYDGRSLYPRQVFFPMAGVNEGWDKLANTLRAFVDEELVESYRGNTSLPFLSGDNKQVAVKIIDDRGIESLRVIKVRD